MLGFGALGEFALGQESSTKSLAIDAGALTITGQQVGLYAARVLEADAGVYALTFNSIDYSRTTNRLRVVGSGGVRGLRASSGGGGKGLRIRA